MKNKNLTLIIAVICLAAAVYFINKWLKSRYEYEDLEENQNEDLEEDQAEDQEETVNNKNDEKEGSDAATD